MAVIKYIDSSGNIQTVGLNSVELSSYATISYMTEVLADYAKTTEVTSLLGNYVTFDDVATESKAGLMSAEDKTTLDNLSGGGGGTADLETLTIGAVTYDGTEAVSAEEATTTTAGLMSASDKTKLDGIEEGANSYTLPQATTSTLGGMKVCAVRSNVHTYTTGGTNSASYYGVELDSDGTAFVNVQGANTQVKQMSVSTSGDYPMLLKYDANTSTQTNSIRFSSTITADPSTGTITANAFTGTLTTFVTQLEEAYGVIRNSELDPADWQVLTYEAGAGAWRVTTIEGDNVTLTEDENTLERVITIGDESWLKKPLWSEATPTASSIEYTKDPDENKIKYKKIRILYEKTSGTQGFSSGDSFRLTNDEGAEEFSIPIFDFAYASDSWYTNGSLNIFFEVRFKSVWNDSEQDYVNRPYLEAWGEFYSNITNLTWKMPLYRDTSFLLPNVDSAPFGDYIDSFKIFLNSGTDIQDGTITVWGEEVSDNE